MMHGGEQEHLHHVYYILQCIQLAPQICRISCYITLQAVIPCCVICREVDLKMKARVLGKPLSYVEQLNKYVCNKVTMLSQCIAPILIKVLLLWGHYT